MKISSLNRGTGEKYHPTSKAKAKKNTDFGTMLDMSKKHQQEQYLSQMIKKINKSGEKVKETQSSVDVDIYKREIANFLKYVLSNNYNVRHVHGRQGMLAVVEVIKQELDNLMKMMLASQRDNINIAGQVDRITGLLIDLCT